MRKTTTKTARRQTAATTPATPPAPAPAAAHATVLLAVTGMSPAVLTETAWALAHETPPILPTHVIAITTRNGAQAIKRELQTPPPGSAETVWQALRREILGPHAAAQNLLILEPPRTITIPNPATGQGEPMDDIRTPDENAAAAEAILDEVRRITANNDTRLIASLAGGRKTMGALLAAAVALLGRKGDRLTHILVNEPFDHPALQPRFYFPPATPVQHRLATPDGEQHISSAQATLQLADVPFVPLRYLFRDHLDHYPGTFKALVNTATAIITPQNITLDYDPRNNTAIIDSTPIKLHPRDFAFWAFLVEHARAGHPPIDSHKQAVDHFKQFLAQWAPKHPHINLEHGGQDWRTTPPEHEDLRKRLHNLRESLTQARLGHLKPILLPTRGPVGFPLDHVTFPNTQNPK